MRMPMLSAAVLLFLTGNPALGQEAMVPWWDRPRHVLVGSGRLAVVGGNAPCDFLREPEDARRFQAHFVRGGYEVYTSPKQTFAIVPGQLPGTDGTFVPSSSPKSMAAPQVYAIVDVAGCRLVRLVPINCSTRYAQAAIAANEQILVVSDEGRTRVFDGPDFDRIALTLDVRAVLGGSSVYPEDIFVLPAYILLRTQDDTPGWLAIRWEGEALTVERKIVPPFDSLPPGAPRGVPYGTDERSRQAKELRRLVWPVMVDASGAVLAFETISRDAPQTPALHVLYADKGQPAWKQVDLPAGVSDVSAQRLSTGRLSVSFTVGEKLSSVDLVAGREVTH